MNTIAGRDKFKDEPATIIVSVASVVNGQCPSNQSVRRSIGPVRPSTCRDNLFGRRGCIIRV